MITVEATFAMIFGVPLFVAVLAALVAVVVFLAATAYAFVKPHVSYLIDTYIDWYERRTQ